MACTVFKSSFYRETLRLFKEFHFSAPHRASLLPKFDVWHTWREEVIERAPQPDGRDVRPMEGATLAPIDGYQLIKRNDLWNGFTEPAATHAGWNFIRYIYAYRVKAGADSVVMLWIYSHGQFGLNNPPTVPPAAERMRAFRKALEEAKGAQS